MQHGYPKCSYKPLNTPGYTVRLQAMSRAIAAYCKLLLPACDSCNSWGRFARSADQQLALPVCSFGSQVSWHLSWPSLQAVRQGILLCWFCSSTTTEEQLLPLTDHIFNKLRAQHARYNALVGEVNAAAADAGQADSFKSLQSEMSRLQPIATTFDTYLALQAEVCCHDAGSREASLQMAVCIGEKTWRCLALASAPSHRLIRMLHVPPAALCKHQSACTHLHSTPRSALMRT